MIFDSKTLIALLAVLPVALGELEPHAVRPRRRHHARSPLLNLEINIGFSAAGEKSEQPGVFRFPYGDTKVRGVNLGGWLVLEPWITPSLFDGTGDNRIVDEYTFGQYQDKAVAKAKLIKHWSTWITERDLAAIAAAGLNHVRIPIGFWAFDVSGGEPYVQGQLPYLCKAIEWAAKRGLKVLIDLHGAPGSQNGFDNSGRFGQTLWHTDPKNVDRTNAIIKMLSEEFSKSKYKNVVTSIAPLNEPAGFRDPKVLDVTRQYWSDSYETIRYPNGDSKQGNLVEVIHDAFQPLSYWNNFLTKPNATGVVMDTHHYEVFSVGENARTVDEHTASICSFGSDNLEAYQQNQNNVVVGEWSLALTDCAKYLNGRGVGARYDGTHPDNKTPIGSCTPKTGSGNDFTSEYKDTLRKFWEVQVNTYETKGSGWIFWTWKNEIAAEWSYQTGLAKGWIPKDPTERKYPNQCS